MATNALIKLDKNATSAIKKNKTMSENIKMEEIVEQKTEATSAPVEAEQDPLKIELDKVQKKEGRTEKERAAYSLKMNAARFKELGGDPTEVLGIKEIPIKTTEDDEDEKPVTLGMLKKFQQEGASKTALQQADEIQNETERELVKYHLANTIKSSGNPIEDLRFARSIVNSSKNSQILEEFSRKVAPKQHSNSSGADANQEKEVVFTSEELTMMKAPFNMTAQEVMDARSGKKFKFKN